MPVATVALVPAPAGYTLLEDIGPRWARVADAHGAGRFLKRLTPRMRTEALARAQLATEVAALQVLPTGVGAPYVAHGEDEAGPWLVEGFLEGCDLDALIARKGALPEAGVRSLFDSGLACLRTLHDAADATGSLAIVHGDLSPGNLFILPSGEVRLVDFELGSLRGMPRPDDGSFRGTLHYASPRVVRGAPPTPADDRFGLAACMLMALAGAAPRSANGPQLLVAAGSAPPPVPTLADRELENALRLALGDAPE